MGRLQRAKGASAERELAKLLSGMVDAKVVRNLQQTRDGGHDLDGLPFAVEVKRQEVLRVRQWWEQAVEQGECCGKFPVLAYRKSRHPWRFVLPCRLLGFEGSDDYEDCVEIGIELFARLVNASTV